MTIEETTKLLKMSDQTIWLKGLEKERRKAEEMAIKSLEAWEEVKQEVNDYQEFILCVNGQKGIHIDKVIEIIDKHLSEVSE